MEGEEMRGGVGDDLVGKVYRNELLSHNEFKSMANIFSVHNCVYVVEPVVPTSTLYSKYIYDMVSLVCHYYVQL